MTIRCPDIRARLQDILLEQQRLDARLDDAVADHIATIHAIRDDAAANRRRTIALISDLAPAMTASPDSAGHLVVVPTPLTPRSA